MELAAYLSEHKIKPAAFAATINVPASTITRILRGERDPRAATIRKIVEGTKGLVTAAELIRSQPRVFNEPPEPLPCPLPVGFTGAQS